MKKEIIIKGLIAGLFSTITIAALTFLTYKTQYGIFLIASFGSSMVLLYGYPESPFAQPKNIFFWTSFNVINRYNLFKFYSFTFVHSNTFCGRIGCKLNDSFKCNSSSGWGESRDSNYRKCVFRLSNKSNINWFNNNFNFWNNFKSTYFKKEISFINGHKV